ncbi:hypothetical protein KFU94_67045 [Chloroflexi bacterium TSY]|nr:hypothetical protein [Chloroflexi bacterium TSY]MBV7336629.1 hypothetical protein [Chloroflexi bacterium TSY]MBV7339477.1 hypothetical protein [Chloroflexi bacterium TSY]MBV7339495.1 hypothetical protein [Chloroflexi bacterium TSY]
MPIPKDNEHRNKIIAETEKVIRMRSEAREMARQVTLDVTPIRPEFPEEEL